MDVVNVFLQGRLRTCPFATRIGAERKQERRQRMERGKGREWKGREGRGKGEREGGTKRKRRRRTHDDRWEAWHGIISRVPPSRFLLCLRLLILFCVTFLLDWTELD